MSDPQQAEVVDEGSIAPDTLEVSALLSHDLNNVCLLYTSRCV